MAKHKSKKKLNVNWGELLVTLLKSNLVAYALTAIFIIAGALILTYTNLGPNFEKWLTLIGAIASAGLVGFDTARMERKQGYKWGAVGGVSYLLIFLVLAMMTGGFRAVDMSYLLVLTVLAVISSMLSGMFSVARQK